MINGVEHKLTSTILAFDTRRDSTKKIDYSVQ